MMHAASLIKYVAFVLMTLFALVGGLFAAGYAIEDPGGWTAALMIASYAVPLVVLSVLALLRPKPMGPVLIVLTVLLVAFNVVDALVGLIPRDSWGPVGSGAALMLAAAIGFLGIHRPLLAGCLLIALALGMAVAVMLTRDVAGGEPLTAVFSGSSGIVVLPLLVIGVLFLIAGRAPAAPAVAAPAH